MSTSGLGGCPVQQVSRLSGFDDGDELEGVGSLKRGSESDSCGESPDLVIRLTEAPEIIPLGMDLRATTKSS